MNFSNELIEKAKTAKSAEELLAMAKAENIEMTAEEAAKYFAELHKTGELADEELDNVAGGGTCEEQSQYNAGLVECENPKCDFPGPLDVIYDNFMERHDSHIRIWRFRCPKCGCEQEKKMDLNPF